MSVTAIPSTPAFTPAPASSSAAASAAAPASSSAPAPVSSRPAASVAAPASSSPATVATARAADGDYKTRNVHTAQIKDSDGDYRPLASSVAAQSSSAVQAALTSLKAGG